MTKSELARQYFESGYNCCQAVVMAFAEEMGVAPDLAANLTAGFGGGLARLREVCGTVSGIGFVLSGVDGDFEVGNNTQKKALYARIQQAANVFKEENGSVVCHELLGLPNGADEPVPSPRTERYYKRRPCSELVAMAAGILEKELQQNS